jgi:hypothetical protein
VYSIPPIENFFFLGTHGSAPRARHKADPGPNLPANRKPALDTGAVNVHGERDVNKSLLTALDIIVLKEQVITGGLSFVLLPYH